MQRRIALVLVLLLTLTTPLLAAQKKPAKAAPRALVVDTHADTPSEYMEHPFDLGAWQTTGHFDYPRMKAGKLDVEFFAAYVPSRYEDKGAAAYCMRIMEVIHQMVERYPSWVRFARSTDDIRRIAAGGKGAILIGIEGGHAIEDSLDLLRAFHRFGARYMTLTHSNNNNWADSSGEPAQHDGLTPFGREVVLEMNRLGMLVDISHVSDKTFFDVIETTKAPVIASHSSARALADHPRNMTDDMLRALTKNRGVVMVNFFPLFLSNEVIAASKARTEKLAPMIGELKKQHPDEGEEYRKAVRELQAQHPLPKIPWTVIVDHIDHIAKVAGVDHVGLGSDFDGISAVPDGMEDVSKLPKLRDELKRRGYSESNIRKIMGENFMRAFAEAERVSKEMSK